MITKLQQHLQQQFPFLAQKRLLLAVSGGLDSVVMLDMFRQLKFEIAVAHCNFTLRGDESDADHEFIRSFAEELQIPFFSVSFDTKAYAEDASLSIQLAARELRYKWFHEVSQAHGYDFILTAHHADDSLETFIINLSRGTGIAGLTGIPAVNGQVLRPMLIFTRQQLQDYAESHHLRWREDSSNENDHYLRNHVRHHLIPALKALNPAFDNSFAQTLNNLQQSKSMADDAAIMVYQQIVEDNEGEKRFNLDKLATLPNANAYLYHWLQPFGFTAWEDIYALRTAQTGKQVFADKYVLLKNRNTFVLSPISNEEPGAVFPVESGQRFVNLPLKLSLTHVLIANKPSNKIIFVDAGKLQFPLTIRKWEPADVFYPNGMGGKSKKVSKLLKDEKQSLRDKEKQWLLMSGSEIVWVIGLRADERFLADKTTQDILQISLLQ